MHIFERASNFDIHNSTFIDNSTGRTQPLSEVLTALKEAAASGVSYDSIDRTQSPSAVLGPGPTADITSTQDATSTEFVYFIHGASPTDTRQYGEEAARQCKERGFLLASVFFRRLLYIFPAEAKRRLVPTLAYQLAVSTYSPPELKIEILGALHLEPDLPERNLDEQFEKLIVLPLQHVRDLLDPRYPPTLLLDSVQCMACDTVGDVIGSVVRAVDRLRSLGIDARAIVTGVGYKTIVQCFEKIPNSSTTKAYAMPITYPKSLSSMVRSLAFPFLDWKYSLPEPLQRGVEVVSALGTVITMPFVIPGIFALILPAPLNLLVSVFGPIFITMAMTSALSVSMSIIAYREAARVIWPRSI